MYLIFLREWFELLALYLEKLWMISNFLRIVPSHILTSLQMQKMGKASQFLPWSRFYFMPFSAKSISNGLKVPIILRRTERGVMKHGNGNVSHPWNHWEQLPNMDIPPCRQNMFLLSLILNMFFIACFSWYSPAGKNTQADLAQTNSNLANFTSTEISNISFCVSLDGKGVGASLFSFDHCGRWIPATTVIGPWEVDWSGLELFDIQIVFTDNYTSPVVHSSSTPNPVQWHSTLGPAGTKLHRSCLAEYSRFNPAFSLKELWSDFHYFHSCCFVREEQLTDRLWKYWSING